MEHVRKHQKTRHQKALGIHHPAAALAIALLRAQFARARVGAVARGTVAVDALPMHAQDQGQGAATTATSQDSA